MKMEKKMKMSCLLNNVKNGYNQSTLKEQKNEFNYLLTEIFNKIQRFEKNGTVDSKAHREKMDILKNFITDLIKHEEQKKIIMGEKIIKKPPTGFKRNLTLI